jgi:hypothetical protein
LSEGGPIFIGGLAHSGKSALRTAIGAHPHIAMTRRSYLWRFYGRFGDLDHSGNLERCLSTMLRDRAVRSLNPDGDRIRAEFLQGPASYARLFGLFHQHHAELLGKPRWGEQIRLIEHFADPIFAAFPTARIIHMTRDPRTTHPGRTAADRPPFGRVGWETASWLSSARMARRNRARYPDRYAVLQYEAFADRPVETLREVCDLIQEEYVDAMEKALSAMGFEAGAGPDRYAHRPASEVSFIEDHAAGELRALRYAVKDGAATHRSLSKLLHRPADTTAMMAWRLIRDRRPARPAGPPRGGK